jgi:hypothetical protein
MKSCKLSTFVTILLLFTLTLGIITNAKEINNIIYSEANKTSQKDNAIYKKNQDNVSIPSAYIRTIYEQSNSLKIIWKKAKVKSYTLYRSKNKNAGYKPIKTIIGKKSSFLDKKVKPYTTYYYKIKCNITGQKNVVSNPVKFTTSSLGPAINFERTLKYFIKENINKNYPCNVLVNKYVNSCSKKGSYSGTGQIKNIKLYNSPIANQWKEGNAKLSYNYTCRKSNYSKKGTLSSTVYPVKSSGTKKAVAKSTTDMSKLKAGDIIVYSNGSRATHVAIYIGKFNSKSSLIKYLNKKLGIKCSTSTTWIKSWNGNCKYWVLQGGMGSNNQVYLCNNANTTGGGSYMSHKITLWKNKF